MNKLLLFATLFLFTIPANAQKATEKDNVINLIKQFDTAIAKKDSLTLSKILMTILLALFQTSRASIKNLS